MSIKCFRYVFIMLCMLSHTAITFSQIPNQIPCQYPPPSPPIPLGDSTKAHLAQRHPTRTGLPHIVQLGYIDSNYATAEEIRNNLPLGLRVWPEDTTRVVRYTIWYAPKNADVCGPYVVDGNKMPPSFLMSVIRDDARTDTLYYPDGGKRATCLYHDLRFYLSKGDRVVFSPIIQRGNEKPFALKEFSITVW